VTAKARLLGVDPGEVRIGLAISDPERRIASPLETYVRRDRDQDARFFSKLVATEEVGGIVVGLPVHLDDREGKSAQAARKFGHWLEKVTGLEVVFWDERFTTREAEELLWEAGLSHKKRRQRRDRVAAQIILQHYLDDHPDQHGK
jgi:putative Holliday junction resolvase